MDNSPTLQNLGSLLQIIIPNRTQASRSSEAGFK